MINYDHRVIIQCTRCKSYRYASMATPAKHEFISYGEVVAGRLKEYGMTYSPNCNGCRSSYLAALIIRFLRAVKLDILVLNCLGPRDQYYACLPK